MDLTADFEIGAARQMLTESILLAALGGAAGLLVASWCVPVLEQLGSKAIPELAQVNIDWRVAGFCAALSYSGRMRPC